MAEPISILASVRTLVTVSYQLGNSVVTLHRRYQQAPQTLSTLSTECSLSNLALARVERMISTRPETLSSEFDVGVDVISFFELALTSWATTFSVLDAEVSKINKSQTTRFSGRVRYILNEDTLKELSRQLRDLRASINLLLDSYQTYLRQFLFIKALMRQVSGSIPLIGNSMKSERSFRRHEDRLDDIAKHT